MINRVHSLDQSRWAAVAQNAKKADEEFQRRVEILKVEKPTFRLLMEQIGEYHLIPAHLKQEAENLMGISGWVLIPIFKESPAE